MTKFTKFIRDLPIAYKNCIQPAISSILLIAFLIFLMIEFYGIEKNTNEVVKVVAPSLNEVSYLVNNMVEKISQAQEYIISEDVKHLHEIDRLEENFIEHFKIIENMPFTAKAKQYIDNIEALDRDYRRIFQNDFRPEILQVRKNLHIIFNEYNRKFKQQLLNIIEYTSKEANQTSRNINYFANRCMIQFADAEKYLGKYSYNSKQSYADIHYIKFGSFLNYFYDLKKAVGNGKYLDNFTDAEYLLEEIAERIKLTISKIKALDKTINVDLKNIKDETLQNASLLQKYLVNTLEHDGHNIEQLLSESTTSSLIGVALSIILTIFVSTSITLLIVNPLRKASKIAANIASGDIENEIDDFYKDDTGKLMYILNNLQSALQHLNHEINNTCDEGLNGVYTTLIDNRAMMGYQRDLTDKFNEFMKLINTSLQDFNHVLRSTSLGDMNSSIIAKYPGLLGEISHNCNLTVKDIQDIYLNVNNMMQKANEGIFSHRIDNEKMLGYKKELCGNVNEFLDISSSNMDEINKALGSLAEGDINSKIKARLFGSYGDTKNYFNIIVDGIADNYNQMKSLMEHASDGDYSHRIKIDKMHGYLQEQATVVNKAMANTENSLHNISKAAKELSEYDLRVTMTGDQKGSLHEIYHNIQDGKSKIAKTIHTMQESVLLVTQGMRSVSRDNITIGNSNSNQNKFIASTSENAEEVTEGIQMGIVDTNKCSEHARQSEEKSKLGGESVSNVISAMKEIESSNKAIADILVIINDITFQVNLLALNAAVEAARAGEHGYGFSVVAKEVGSLSQKSTNSAKEIKLLIQDSVEKVARGTILAEEAGVSLGEIYNSVSEVNNIIRAISDNTGNQSQGIKRVCHAVEKLKKYNTEDSELTSQIEKNSTDITKHSDKLEEAIRKFILPMQA